MATTAGVRLAAETLYKEDPRVRNPRAWKHGIHQGSASKYFVILISLSDPSFLLRMYFCDENAKRVRKSFFSP